jgi:5'-3' exonuclease
MAVAVKDVVSSTDVVTTEEIDRSKVIKLWLGKCLTFILRLYNADIQQIYILDGDKEQNIDKRDTHEKRAKQREKVKHEIDQMRQYFTQAIRANDILSITSDKIARMKTLLYQQVVLDRASIDAFVEIITSLGIPYARASGDGERLCSILCVEGKVDAVFSSDTDCYAHGCHTLISDFADPVYDESRKSYEPQVSVVKLIDILANLKLSYTQFVDLCIMAGCDYNNSCSRWTESKTKKEVKKEKEEEIKEEKEEEDGEDDEKKEGKRKRIRDTKVEGNKLYVAQDIGIGRAYKALEVCKSIDNLSNDYRIECLNHVKCRELFQYRESQSLLIDGSLSMYPKSGLEIAQCARDMLSMYSLSEYADKFLSWNYWVQN